MKPLYLIFGLWILIVCFPGEGDRGQRRQHNPRRQQDPSTLPHHLCLQPNGVQMRLTRNLPPSTITVDPPPFLVCIPGFISGAVFNQLGTTEYHYQCQLTAPDPRSLSNPPNQLHTTEQANTKTDDKISNTTATTQNSTDTF
uniref:SMR1 protein-like n=1 Tax=Rattus norvegicus TaxID=10116 RepID=A0A8I6AT01_RAT